MPNSKTKRKQKTSYAVGPDGRKIKNTPHSGGGKHKLGEAEKVRMSKGMFARIKQSDTKAGRKAAERGKVSAKN